MKIIAGVLLVLIFCALAAAYFIFRISCGRRKGHPTPCATSARPLWPQKVTQGKEWFLSKNYTLVSTRSADGLLLKGYYLSAGSKDTLILMHGYHAEALYEFCPLVQFYHELGYNLLLPHQRAHGESEGKYLSFGIKEREDMLCWTEFLMDNFAPENIFFSGISMGGATVLMSSTLSLPDKVRGIIADCPFADPVAQFRYSFSKRFRLPSGLFLYLCGIWSRVLAGWHFTDFDIADLSAARLPLLLLHGTADPVVPHTMSQAIMAHYGGPKQMILFENCAHAYACIQDPLRYQQAVTDFLHQHKE